MGRERDVYSKCNLFAWTDFLIQGKGAKGRNKSQDHPPDSIDEVGQNTNESHSDLKKLVVSQTSAKDSANVSVKKTNNGTLKRIVFGEPSTDFQ